MSGWIDDEISNGWVEDEVPGGWATIGAIGDVISGIYGGDYGAFVNAHSGFVNSTEPGLQEKIRDGNWIEKESTQDWLFPFMGMMGYTTRSDNTDSVLDLEIISGSMTHNANAFLDKEQQDEYDKYYEDKIKGTPMELHGKFMEWSGDVIGAVGGVIDGLFSDDENLSLFGWDTGISGWDQISGAMPSMGGGMMGGDFSSSSSEGSSGWGSVGGILSGVAGIFEGRSDSGKQKSAEKAARDKEREENPTGIMKLLGGASSGLGDMLGGQGGSMPGMDMLGGMLGGQGSQGGGGMMGVPSVGGFPWTGGSQRGQQGGMMGGISGLSGMFGMSDQFTGLLGGIMGQGFPSAQTSSATSDSDGSIERMFFGTTGGGNTGSPGKIIKTRRIDPMAVPTISDYYDGRFLNDGLGRERIV